MADIYVKETCEAKHERVDDRLDHHESWLREHEGKIDVLKESDATNKTEIKNLCLGLDRQAKAIGNQTKAIWGLVTSILVLMIGYFLSK